MRAVPRLVARLVAAIASFALAACQSASARENARDTAREDAAPLLANGAPCGHSPEDWCPSPAGDPCGAHHTTATCKADARCTGIHYAGESVVACRYDARGFATNCPTVGCVTHD